MMLLIKSWSLLVCDRMITDLVTLEKSSPRWEAICTEKFVTINFIYSTKKKHHVDSKYALERINYLRTCYPTTYEQQGNDSW